MSNRARTALWGILAGMLIGGLAVATPTAAAGSLRIVFIAYENPDQLIEDVEPVIAYLEKRLGVEVEHFAATDYAAVVEALRNESADVGFMGPLQYLMAHQEAGAYPILGEIYNGSPTYVSRIFVRKDSGIRALQDLRGKTIAFVDPISSSGYLYPLEIFIEAGLIQGREGSRASFARPISPAATSRPSGRSTTASWMPPASASTPSACCGPMSATRS